MSGPSVASLLCEWTCAAKHLRTEAAGSCHQHGSPQSTSTVAAGHPCHDLASAPNSILADARPSGVAAQAIAESPFALPVESPVRGTHRALDVFHAPPPHPPLTLRI